jgi:hypothetical protein
LGFYGLTLVGAWGIYSQSITWGLIYTGVAMAGLVGGVLYGLCSHCPYPYDHSDCLFMPYPVIKRLYRFRPEPLTPWDKIGFIAGTLVVVLMPQYWLVKEPLLLALFWILCLPTLATFPLYYCKKCRHILCPFNCVKQNGEPIPQ